MDLCLSYCTTIKLNILILYVNGTYQLEHSRTRFELPTLSVMSEETGHSVIVVSSIITNDPLNNYLNIIFIFFNTSASLKNLWVKQTKLNLGYLN